MKKKPVYQINPDDLTIVKEWESVSAAATEMSFPQPSICAAAQGKRISANGFYWCFVEDYESFQPKKRKTKKVMCVETNMIYDSIKEAAAATGLNESSIRKCCTNILGVGVYKGQHWKYYDEAGYFDTDCHNSNSVDEI
jgi:hypothetical protein